MPISTVEEALEITLAKPIKKIKKDILPKDKSSEAEVLSFASRAISLINPEHFGHQVLPKKQRSDFSNRNAKRRFSFSLAKKFSDSFLSKYDSLCCC